MSGAGSWGHALSKAQHLVSQMSLEEKVSLTGGSKDSRNGCGGNIPAIDRLGFPGMCLQDGPNGIKGVELVNGYPSGIHVGASLAYKQAKAIGGEFRRKGATIALGPPVVGPLGRIALGGRNWEGYTNDPYLSGVLAAEAVRGVQDNGVISCAKLDFQGFVMSDWGAQHTGIASALAGLDMVMPSGNKYWGAKLIEAVRNGSVPESQITNMATRIMAAWYLSNQDDPSLPPVGAGIPADFERQHPVIDARDPHDESLLLEGAIQGHVLLKNVDNALPLTNPRILSIYGYDAKAPDSNFAQAGLNDWTLGLESHDSRTVVCGFASIGGDCPDFPPIAINGTIISGGGSAAVTPVYISSPFQALEARARQDKTQLFWDFKGTEAVNSEADACLVFINAASSEGVDRPALRDDYSDGLVLDIASRCNNTIVVIHNAGVRLIDQWIEHPNVTAVIFAHLPGQDSGDAITQILYGDVSPSGKLPYSLPRNESDYGSLLAPVTFTDWDQLFPQDDFTEGVFIDYRAFDMKGIAPRFEFGYGMTYTTFKYSNLTIRWTVDPSDLSEYPEGPVIPGGNADLWEDIAAVTADITNTGQMEAAEIAQLYVQIPGEGQPLLQLRGFDKVAVPPGETRTVDFNIRRRDLSTWDVAAQKWKLSVGVQYPVFVGSSSRKLLLNGTLYL
ncbi:unnamed protein product [Aspergillus oryzae]|uniref:Probable beta-glucosidase M n=1 Tax=Aspergillus oryzae TaxID=5062 RepID=A0AAN5BMM2_ASPOZ|nr:unnamed protein product [Aspergillus oryzae]GMF83804.1 unnamed protein product [Aspergillus oryzae]GMG23471.1 unnamed protein product [Aspergillus oryzae]